MTSALPAAQTLPDISRLANLDRDALRALRKRLAEVGLDVASIAATQQPWRALPSILSEPLKSYYLQKRDDDLARTIRLFMFSDRLTAAEAESAVGAILPRLLDAGLLRVVKEEGRDGDSVECPFVLGLLNDIHVVCDRLVGEDGVMGFGDTSIALARASFPLKPVRAALDVGCGAGTVALFLAKGATRVVGTDIDPRAIELARFNARLNEIANVEFRLGDLLAPVGGETFDLVVSQPPFLARPDGAEAKVLTHGGHRGDELALRLMSGLSKVLTRGGLAVLRVDWLVVEPTEGAKPGPAGVADRIRAHLGPELDVTLISPPPVTLDGYAARYAAAINPSLDARYVASFAARRDHLLALKGQAVLASITLVHRSGESPGATSTRFMSSEGEFSRENVRAVLDAQVLIRDEKKLLAANLRVPKGTVFAEEQEGVGSEVESTIKARFAPTAIAQNVAIDARLLFILTAIHESDTVKEGIAKFAAEAELEEQQALDLVLPAVREALRSGTLTTLAEG